MRYAYIPVMAIMLTIAGASCTSDGTKGNANAELLHKDTTAKETPGRDINYSRGILLFQQKCKVCHSMDGNAINSRAANLQRTVLDSMTIAYTIKNGRKDMPGFLDMPDSDIAQITLYVKSIRTH